MLSAAKNLRASLFLREDVDSSLRSAWQPRRFNEAW